jgi:hypothetical protein
MTCWTGTTACPLLAGSRALLFLVSGVRAALAPGTGRGAARARSDSRPARNVMRAPALEHCSVLCDHHVCRCAAADRAARIYDRTGRAADLLRAIGMHSQPVPCQLPQPCGKAG